MNAQHLEVVAEAGYETCKGPDDPPWAELPPEVKAGTEEIARAIVTSGVPNANLPAEFSVAILRAATALGEKVPSAPLALTDDHPTEAEIEDQSVEEVIRDAEEMSDTVPPEVKP